MDARQDAGFVLNFWILQDLVMNGAPRFQAVGAFPSHRWSHGYRE